MTSEFYIISPEHLIPFTYKLHTLANCGNGLAYPVLHMSVCDIDVLWLNT